MKIAFFASLFLTAPYTLFQIWRFVSPGLYKKEKRFVFPFVFFSTILFVGGILFGYFIALPPAFRFFVSFSTDFLKPMISFKEYLSLTLWFLLAFGLWIPLAVAGAREAVVEPGSALLFQYPFLFACGHGNLKLTPTEAANLRRYLTTGGFLWVDDDYGIDASFRRAMRQVFPDAPLVELPFSHPVFHGPYEFPDGLPKIHEHSGGPARAFGIHHGGRLVVFYSFDTDLGDGLEDAEVHGDPPEQREAALRMALNLVHYALTH